MSSSIRSRWLALFLSATILVTLFSARIQAQDLTDSNGNIITGVDSNGNIITDVNGIPTTTGSSITFPSDVNSGSTLITDTGSAVTSGTTLNGRAVEGSYYALIQSGSADLNTTGLLKLRVSHSGDFTADLQFGVKDRRFRGTLDSTGAATVILGGSSDWTISLNVDASTGDGVVSGSVQHKGDTGTIATTAREKDLNASKLEGTYTLIFTNSGATTTSGNSIGVSGTEIALSGTDLVLSGTDLTITESGVNVSGTEADISGSNLILSGSDLTVSQDLVTGSNTEIVFSGSNLLLTGSDLNITENSVTFSGTAANITGTNLVLTGSDVNTSANNVDLSGSSTAPITGVGSVTVFRKGKLVFTGYLADGSRVVQIVHLANDFSWQLFISYKQQQQILIGTVTFSNQTDSDCSGTVTLVGKSFNEIDDLVGSVFKPSYPILSVTPGVPNIRMVGSGGNTSAGGFSVNGTLAQDNKVTMDEKGYAAFIDSNHGLFSAGFLLTGTTPGPTAQGFGVIFQKQNLAAGMFSNENSRGVIRLLMGTAAETQ